MNKHKVLKLVAVAYLLIGLVLILPLSMVSAPYTGTSPVIMGGTQVKSYSYCIWIQGSTYYATNGLTGQVDYSGSDASTIIQNSIDALQSNIHGYYAGRVFATSGQYNLSSSLLIQNPNIILEGEGRATEFLQTNSSLPYLIRIVSSRLAPENTYTGFVQIKNILFWSASPSSTYAIYFNNAEDIIWFPLVEDCTFINLNGIRTDSDAFGTNQVLQFPTFNRLIMESPPDCGINLTSVIDAKISNIHIFSSTQQAGTYGIYINATITSGIVLDKVTVVRQGFGLWLADSDDTQIINSFFDLCNDTYSVQIEDSSRVEVGHTYVHAPYGTGFIISGSSNLTRFISSTAKLCNVGVNDTTTTNCTQYLIGFISAEDCTTQYDLDATDVVRGCLGIGDQG